MAALTGVAYKSRSRRSKGNRLLIREKRQSTVRYVYNEVKQHWLPLKKINEKAYAINCGGHCDDGHEDTSGCVS